MWSCQHKHKQSCHAGPVQRPLPVNSRCMSSDYTNICFFCSARLLFWRRTPSSALDVLVLTRTNCPTAASQQIQNMSVKLQHVSDDLQKHTVPAWAHGLKPSARRASGLRSGFTLWLSDLILLSESVRAAGWVQCTCMCSQQPAVLEGWPLWADTRRQQEGKTPFQQEVKNPDQGWVVRKESIRKEDVSSCAINVQEVTAVQPSK